MGISGAIAASFYNPDTGVVVQFNHISGDSEFSHSAESELDIKGNGIFAGDESSLSLVVAENTGINQMKKWERENTKLNFVLAGNQENILWYEPSTVTVSDHINFTPNTRSYRTIQMNRSGGIHKIWKGVNLLHGANVVQGLPGWDDEDEDGVADGYVINNSLSTSFNTPKQIIEGADSSVKMEKAGGIIFPISNIRLDISATSIAGGNNSGGWRHLLLARDYQDIFLSQSLAETAPEESTKRLFSGFKTPIGVFKIDPVFVEFLASADAYDAVIQNPAIRTDGLNDYIKG